MPFTKYGQILTSFKFMKNISFDENDLNLLSALGNQAAVALDNARLFKDINKTKK